MSSVNNSISFTFNEKSYQLDLGSREDNSTDIHNLQTLFARKRGTLFRADDSGRLVEIKGWCDRLSYRWNRKSEDRKVKSAINSALRALNAHLAALEDTAVAQNAARYLFNPRGERGMGRLGKALYSKYKLTQTDTTLSQYLMPPCTVRLNLQNGRFLDLKNNKFKDVEYSDPISIDLGDETTNHNFWKLLKRQKGEIYHVDHEDKLQSLPASIRGDRELRRQIDARVKRVVTDVLTKLSHQIENSEVSLVHQLALREIFAPYNPLCRLKGELLCRREFRAGSRLEQYLAPDLWKKREVLTDALMQLEGQPEREKVRRQIDRALMDTTFEEFKFALMRGIELQRNKDGGTGGARYGLSRYLDRVIVAKPNDEGANAGKNNPNWFKKIFGWSKWCLYGNSEAMAEVDSYLFDRIGLWTVPPTKIEYIGSSQFVGEGIKECSVQMFVEGCITLKEYLENSALSEEDLLSKIPFHVLELVAIHDWLTENMDTHEENILVKIFVRRKEGLPVEKGKEKKSEDDFGDSDEAISREEQLAEQESILERLFSGQEVERREVKKFVTHMFEYGGHQRLLEYLLFSEEVEVDGEKKRVMLVHHDGGASNPHSHPSWWDYLSLRNKHKVFRKVPHTQVPFSEETRRLFQGEAGDKRFAAFLLKKGIANLKNIMTEAAYAKFISSEENKKAFNSWIFETEPALIKDHRKALVEQCTNAAVQAEEEGNKAELIDWYGQIDPACLERRMRKVRSLQKRWHRHFEWQLKRIHANLRARTESYRILKKHVSSDQPMRWLFESVRTDVDFKRELDGLNDGFEKFMSERKERELQPAVSNDASLDISALLHDDLSAYDI